MGRVNGRITRQDVQAAGLRRWDGRNRVTTDWVNIFYEPELHWPNGDLLIYLRQPGQSSRGPAFRVHSARLRQKGFQCLLDQATETPQLPTSSQCTMSQCRGCASHMPVRELYLPAPDRTTLDAVFAHHTVTRNIFAFIYNLPLTGRALGESLINLMRRLEDYRPTINNANDIVAYAESQRYLDFRECVDHALGALYLAETLELKDLYGDAFAHCVGMSHRGMRDSLEYQHLSGRTKTLISRARLDMDAKLNRVAKSITRFFEDELSSSSLGLHEVARDHLDRFRSFLHGYYIEQHGFWPPDKFDEEVVQRLVCTSMYSDFRSLYHHLADEASTTDMTTDLESTGGVCTLQNIQAFDSRYQLEPLPQSLPLLPSTTKMESTMHSKSQRRNSWNPVLKRKQDKELRHAQRTQALIDSSNRDWRLMSCLLVRRYSDFEAEFATDGLESISLADGRKVRWIVVYGILQTLASIMQAPKQARNTDGLSYALCCSTPARFPWQAVSVVALPVDGKRAIEPDVAYSHTNVVPTTAVNRSLSKATSVKATSTKVTSTKERRKSIGPLMTPSLSRNSSALRAPSLTRLMPKRSTTSVPDVPKRPAAFCEIYIPGYGNGLNAAEVTSSPVDITNYNIFTKGDITKDDELLTLSGSNSVSRESSNASTNSTWSKGSTISSENLSTPGDSPITPTNKAFTRLDVEARKTSSPDTIKASTVRIAAESEGLDTVFFNTQTWDEMLSRS